MISTKENWETRYSQHEYIYGKRPNEFLRVTLQGKTPGRILLPCEGEGRNAVYAAGQGWIVDAFDQSINGQVKCMALAAENGVKVNYQIADATEFDAGTERYDMIALIFVHLPPEIRKSVHQKLAGALKTGGMLVLEAFNPQQLRNSSGGPKNKEMLYTPDMLRDDFGTLKIQYLEKVETHIDEGRLHSGLADVVRLIAVK